MTDLSVEQKSFDVVSPQDVVAAFQSELQQDFAVVSVSYEDSPDLRQEPYYLAKEGISGSCRLADIGGPPNLTPLVNRDKYYDLINLPNWVELPEGIAIGAGAGPWKYVGTNSELMANFAFGPSQTEVKSWVAKIDKSNNTHVVEPLPADETNCALMLNLLCSEGKPGKVIKVICEGRKGETNFVTAMTNALRARFPGKFIGMGGVFIIRRGKARLHVMPEFSDVPLNSDAEVDEWLKFFEMPSPLTCLSVFVSEDRGLDLRLEHTHCFSTHGDGGHYHYDTTPQDVSYEGYFVLAENIYRIDRPVVHKTGSKSKNAKGDLIAAIFDHSK